MTPFLKCGQVCDAYSRNSAPVKKVKITWVTWQQCYHQSLSWNLFHALHEETQSHIGSRLNNCFAEKTTLTIEKFRLTSRPSMPRCIVGWQISWTDRVCCSWGDMPVCHKVTCLKESNFDHVTVTLSWRHAAPTWGNDPLAGSSVVDSYLDPISGYRFNLEKPSMNSCLGKHIDDDHESNKYIHTGWWHN